MNQKLREKVMEALSSVLPITAILLALSVTVVPIPIGTVLLFLAGAVLLILGMGLFSLGADMAMMPMGEAMGSRLTRTRRIGLVVLVFFLMGVIVTVAEPDLAVLARQVPAIPDSVLILTVAAGVGSFLVLAMLRTLFKVKLGHLLIFFYALVFGVALFAPKSFLAVAFDSGGVTTGPITVPFIMALGLGVSSAGSRSSGEENSFGMVALCSIGPILAVLIMGMCMSSTEISYTPFTVTTAFYSQEAGLQFLKGFPVYMKEVSLGLLPVIAFFGIFYALSGYMAAYSWNIMWLDCIILFPLIMLGLERLVEEKRGMMYCLTLGVSILSNYYISIMTCIFMVIYFAALLILGTGRGKSLKDYGAHVGQFTVYSLLAGKTTALM